MRLALLPILLAAPSPDPSGEATAAIVPPIVPVRIQAFHNSFKVGVRALPMRDGGDLIAAEKVSHKVFKAPRCAPGGAAFVPVLDADVAADPGGYWQEFRITFDKSLTCQQLTSAGLIEGYAAQGLLSVAETPYVYKLLPPTKQ
ncbi:MAG: hypothetical protein FJZ01_10125 [Candidatus Sericytochromatia bacterium]|nr:hypothetical protein [Candidatus Tanganyikabacteria bacterium]